MASQKCRCGRVKRPDQLWCDKCHKEAMSGKMKLSIEVKEHVKTRHAVAQHLEDHGLASEVPKELYR